MIVTEKPLILQVGAALNAGGVERGIVEMSHYLSRENWPNIIASAGGALVSDLPKSVKHATFNLTSKNPLCILANAWNLACLIRKDGVKIVHARSRAPAWAAWTACKFTGAKFVTTFHGTHGHSNCVKRFYNSVMMRGKWVIANSEFIKQHLIEVYGVDESRIIVAARGVDLTTFNPETVRGESVAAMMNKFNIVANLPIILIPGRISPWKGQDIALEALYKIKTLKWQALIIGDGDKKQTILQHLKSEAARLGIADRVKFIGHRKDLEKFYSIASVTVSAATKPEAFGRTLIEAQAMECPVVAAAHGGALETVVNNKTGWLFKPKSVDDLAEKLAKAIENTDKLKKMGRAGREHVVNKFTVEKMCAKEASVYKMLVQD